MTERLYYNDAFLREFDARVISCEQAGELWKVVLDRTAFYPTSGGQPHDLGTLAGVPVVEVADAEDHSVVHYTDAAIGPGPVRGRIDWVRRFDHMQQHTGQHLLSAVFIELFQFQTVSFHLGGETSTIDLQAPAIVQRHLDEAERHANELIFEDRVVSVRFGTAEELAAAGIRKEVDRQGVLRAVEIEGVDRQPCGGTHLARTGQAGLLLLRGLERRRDVWRVEFICGLRALGAARADYLRLGEAASLLSCGRPEVARVVEKVIEERRAQHTAVKRIEETLAGYQARALLAEVGLPAGDGRSAKEGPRLISALLPEATLAYLKLLAARVLAEYAIAAGEPAGKSATAAPDADTAGVIVLLASASSGAVVLAQSPPQSSGVRRDLGAILRVALMDFAGRGGGSPTFSQGSLPSVAKAGECLERLKSLLSAGTETTAGLVPPNAAQAQRLC